MKTFDWNASFLKQCVNFSPFSKEKEIMLSFNFIMLTETHYSTVHILVGYSLKVF